MHIRNFFIALFLLPVLLFSQNDSVKTTLSEVVVSATKTQTPYYTVASSVSVITSDMIARRQLSTVAEVLREIPGVSISQQGGPGKISYVNIRGANTNHTLVIVDGAEMNDPSSPNNAYDFSSLNTNDIEKIEVLRGPQSTLYGSDAIAGVINIITKKGNGKTRYSFTTEGGSNGFYRGILSASGSSGIVNYFLSASKIGSDGISAADSKFGNNEKDGFKNNNITANLNFDFTDGLKFNLMYKYTNLKSDIDQNAMRGDDPNFIYKTDEQIFKGSFLLKLFEAKWDQQITATFVKRLSSNIDGVDELHPVISSEAQNDAQRIKFDWQNNIRILKSNLISIGIETETEKANTSYLSNDEWGSFQTVFPRQSIYTFGMYFQDQINVANSFFTTIGWRYDENQKYGSINTYRIAPAYFISSTGTKLRASFGTGFKAPSLYYIFDPAYGNPDLKPEKSKGFDVGIDQSFTNDNYQIGITYFNLKLDNMFGFDSNYRTINIAKASSSGIEFFASVKNVFGFSASANYTYTKTKDEYVGTSDYNLPLLRRPAHKFFIGLNYSPATEFNFGLNVKYSGERDDKYFDPVNYTSQRVTLADYTIFGFSASYKIIHEIQLTARVENLFDKKYEEVFLYGTLGRSFYAGINFNL